MLATIKKTLALLSLSDKRKSLGLIILMGIQASMEIGVLGLVMPFVSLISDPSQLGQHRTLNLIYQALGLRTPTAFLLWMGGILVFLIIFKNIFQAFLLWLQTRTLVRIQLGMEHRLMSSYLRRNYLFHVQKNPAELFQNMRSVSAIVNLILSPLLSGITELLILIIMLSFLLYLRPVITLIALALLGGIVLTAYIALGRHMKQIGDHAQQHATAMDQWMMQSFGGIKEIKILGKELFFLDKTLHHSIEYSHAQLRGVMTQQISRPLIEGLGFSLIILSIMFQLAFGGANSTVLPTLILFVAAAFRLMPSFNRIISSMLTIRQGTSRVDAVTKELNAMADMEAEEPDSSGERIHLHDRIELNNIVYRYPGASRASLDGLSMSIPKGGSVALVGRSGAGKTTIVDLLLGLLPYYEGDMLIDGVPLDMARVKPWRRNFGYIPQTIYLSDDTIRRNIAFGLTNSEIDEDKVRRALAAAQLEDVIANLPDGLDTMVGDRGVRLSGGQRQRIGIARALYNDPEILILDEATSALDNETEHAVSSAIRSLSRTKTIIMIAHRLSTVVHCDRIFFIENGRIEAQGTFAELSEENAKFKEFAKPH